MEKILSVFQKFNFAWEAKDINALVDCFHPEWEFHMHSSGKIIKLEEWKTFFGAMLANPKVTRENVRCIYENDEIMIVHSIGTFPNGSKDAIMYVGLLKDGKIWRTETGSTPLSS